MKNKELVLVALIAIFSVGMLPAVFAQPAENAQSSAPNRIDDLKVVEQGGVVYVRLTLRDALAKPPVSFTVANPPRIALDFSSTVNGLGRAVQEVGEGDLRSANVVQVGDRTRLVLNMTRVGGFDTRVEGRDVVVSLFPARNIGGAVNEVVDAVSTFSAGRSSELSLAKSVRDIQFRRGVQGEGRVVVQLSNPDVGIDIRQQGGNLIVDFPDASLPEQLRRRSDVTDFGTPISSLLAQVQGGGARLIVTPNGIWEHNAYQSDTQFVLEVKRLEEDPNRLVQSATKGYQGEKLSLNFQNIDVRSVLQVIADFTDFNIVTSDTVQGNVTLRLQDVPWDQALDIILQSKGLDKRKSGNVIWIAPSEELQTREKLQLEAMAQIGDLEPLKTESFQINYHKAKEIFGFLKSKDQTLLSPRGSVVLDERSNKVFITDVGMRLDEIRRLITEIDVPPRQVLIEARIVEANKNFARDLGVRMGVGGVGGKVVGYDSNGKPIRQGTIGGGLESTAANAGQVVGTGTFDTEAAVTSVPGGLNLNMPVTKSGAGALSMVLWNSAATRFLNLELSALESDGRGRVISSPRVLTANQVEATIEQGDEIPYEVVSDSGTNVQFKKAVLSLKVRPQITPDGRVQLSVVVNKDRADYSNLVKNVPPIQTKNITTEVLVTNGGTVVIGGIYEEETSESVSKIPLLGDIPYVGSLFRNTSRSSGTTELLVFITPRIVSEDLNLR